MQFYVIIQNCDKLYLNYDKSSPMFVQMSFGLSNVKQLTKYTPVGKNLDIFQILHVILKNSFCVLSSCHSQLFLVALQAINIAEFQLICLHGFIKKNIVLERSPIHACCSQNFLDKSSQCQIYFHDQIKDHMCEIDCEITGYLT